MTPEKIDFKNYPSKLVDLKSSYNGTSSGFLFGDRVNSYMNEYSFYLTYFGYIPNLISQSNFDCENAIPWFSKRYKEFITDTYFSKLCFKDSDEPQIDDFYFLLYEDLLVNFDTHNQMVRFIYRKTDFNIVEQIRLSLKPFVLQDRNNGIPYLHLLVKTSRGIDVKSLTINSPRLNLQDNYNDDFKSIHEVISKRLSQKNDKGIVLLHGRPGTGKTSYIRYLISSIKKNVIFLPTNMAEYLSNPDFLALLIDNANSVLVIEDAETILLDRQAGGNNAVSTLLNIADGLLSDCLNIQLICSFNTDLSRVDNALLRKGRLIANYEFKELETEKANALSRKLGFSTVYNSPVPLSTIYNQNEPDAQMPLEKKQIGFKAVYPN